MNGDIFISIGFDTAIKKYILFTEKHKSELVTDYFVYVVMMLTYIYGKLDIMNPYLARYSDGANSLRKNLGKYGLNDFKLHKFFMDLDNFLEVDNYNKVCGTYKNPYFLFIQEDLIDMFLCKCSSVEVSTLEKSKFRSLLYSSKNSNMACRRINELYNVSLDGALRYFDASMMRNSYHLVMIPKKNNLLDERVYKLFGISISDIHLLNGQTLNEINNGIYNYFHINPIGIHANNQLLSKVSKMENTKFRLSNNSGSVNFLLFFSFFMILILIGIGIGFVLV